jgi:hypothetical protein
VLKLLILATLLVATQSAAFARSADCYTHQHSRPLEDGMTHVSGTLVCEPSLGNFDFDYLPGMSAPVSMLQTDAVLQLQARLVWGGMPGHITTAQHAVVAYTQRGATNTMINPHGQRLFTHGAGAILANNGLGLELWRRDDPAGDGFDDDFANAVAWTQADDRQARDVATDTVIGMQLSSTPNAWGFLTPAPSFSLQRGVAYWLRIKLYKDSAADRTTLYADLIEETLTGLVLVQSGLVIFPTSVYFPVAGQALEATVARTPATWAEPVIQYDAFNSGF